MQLTKTNLTDIADTLARHYRWNFHMATNWDSTDVLQAYLEALAHAYDPHSDYLNNEHAQDFSINMSLSLFGIGAQLVEDDGYCTISKILTAARRAKANSSMKKTASSPSRKATSRPWMSWTWNSAKSSS